MARKDHELQIPICKEDIKLQFNIYPMTNPKQRVGKYHFNETSVGVLIVKFRQRKHPNPQLLVFESKGEG